MKKIFLVAVLAELCTAAIGQTNNPYDQHGKDYLASFTMIQNDFYAGKAGDFSEATLQHYSKIIPLKNKPSVEVAAAMLKLRTAGTLDFSQFLESSSLSPVSRKVFGDILFSPGGLSDAAFREAIKDKVDQVVKAAIAPGEKELVLSLLAIAYYMTDSGSQLLRGAERRGCWIVGPYGEGPGTPAQCAAAGAFIGGVIGWSVCGFFCALGGAVIGGVAGALS